MVNYEELPLFPLNVVLYPEMPLPLHIFEPRYREMIMRCREENSPFGVILIQHGDEVGEAALTHAVGTTARITHTEEMDDGRLNILVSGETRFRVLETLHHHPYLTARVEPFAEDDADPAQVQASFDTVSSLFRDYLKTLFSQNGRPLSTLQLPQEPEYLSYAIATFMQISLGEKQRLLEMTATEARLDREIEILGREIEAQNSVMETGAADEKSVILPVDTQALGRWLHATKQAHGEDSIVPP